MSNTVTHEQVQDILDHSQVECYTIFGKTTVVAVKLENGFVIVESSSCVDPANYSQKMGFDICMERIANKVWELEGYKLQDSLFVRDESFEEIEDDDQA